MFSVFWGLVCLKLSATLKCLIHFWTIMILFWLIKCLWTKWNPRSLLSVVHTSSSCSWSDGGPAGERNRSCLVFTLQTKSVNTESRCCLWEKVISDTLRLQDQKPSCSTSQINTVLCQWDFNIFWTLCILSFFFLLLTPAACLNLARFYRRVEPAAYIVTVTFSKTQERKTNVSSLALSESLTSAEAVLWEQNTTDQLSQQSLQQRHWNAAGSPHTGQTVRFWPTGRSHDVFWTQTSRLRDY